MAAHRLLAAGRWTVYPGGWPLFHCWSQVDCWTVAGCWPQDAGRCTVPASCCRMVIGILQVLVFRLLARDRPASFTMGIGSLYRR